MFPPELLAFVDGVPPTAAPPRGLEAAEAFATLRRLTVPGLPGYKVLDCRPLSLSMTATTSDPAVAAGFTARRSDDGTRLRDALVPDPVRVACALPLPGFDRPEGPLFRAPEMEWKWDVTLLGDRVCFSRSWTGELLVTAELRGRGDDAVIVGAEVNRALCAGDARTAVCLVQALSRIYILAKLAPHPLPDLPGGPPVGTDREAFMYSWSLHGRAAFFAAPMSTLP